LAEQANARILMTGLCLLVGRFESVALCFARAIEIVREKQAIRQRKGLFANLPYLSIDVLQRRSAFCDYFAAILNGPDETKS